MALAELTPGARPDPPARPGDPFLPSPCDHARLLRPSRMRRDRPSERDIRRTSESPAEAGHYYTETPPFWKTLSRVAACTAVSGTLDRRAARIACRRRPTIGASRDSPR